MIDQKMPQKRRLGREYPVRLCPKPKNDPDTDWLEARIGRRLRAGQSSRRYSFTQRSGSVPPSFFTLKRSPDGPGMGVVRHKDGFWASCWRNSSVAQI